VLGGGIMVCGNASELLELLEVVASAKCGAVVVVDLRSGGPCCFCRAEAAACWDCSCAAKVLISALTDLSVVPRADSSARLAEECDMDFLKYRMMAVEVQECRSSDWIRLTSTPEVARWWTIPLL
jgi:hypothetical protein